MFKPYVNHAAQHLADMGAVGGVRLFSNILHLKAPSLQSSINITKLVENATRFSFLLNCAHSFHAKDAKILKSSDQHMRRSVLGKRLG